MRKDKQIVVDEVWDDARIASFLAPLPAGFTDAPFQLLVRAYRGMRPEDFERFLVVYAAAGHDLDARSERGLTLRDELGLHRHAAPYLDALARVATATGQAHAHANDPQGATPA